MSAKVVRSEAAFRDLDEQARYLQGDSLQLAIRFLEAAEETFERLAAAPEMGQLQGFVQLKLADVRVWRIAGFENHLVFYRTIEGGVETVRVLHGARDLPAVLEEEA